MMQTPIDLFERGQQEMAEQAANDARIRERNVKTFTKMWLSLGPDCITATGSSHEAEIAEALGLASWRWSQLFSMERQIESDGQILAARSKTRPAQFGDDQLPDRTLEKLNKDYVAESAGMKDALEELGRTATNERKVLEGYTAKPRR